MNNNFLSRLVMLLGAIVLTCNVAWGDNEKLNSGFIKYTVNGGEAVQYNYSSGDKDHVAVNLGTITSNFTVTHMSFQFSDNWTDHGTQNPNMHMKYAINNDWDHASYITTDNWFYNWTTWWLYSDFSHVVAQNTDPSGIYTMKYLFHMWWTNNATSDINNNGSNYTFTYTILPPNVSSGNLKVTTSSEIICGEGSSSKPWLVLVGDTLTLSGNTSTLDWNDANSSVYLSTSQNSGYASTLEYSPQQPDETAQSVTVYGKCYNSTDSLYSATARSKTVYYQFVQPRTVNFDAGTGSVTSSSMTEASYGAGITLPAATPQTDCAIAGWTFAGWAKEEITEETSTAPTLYTAGSTYTDITDGETLYAVYKKGDAAYELVTSDSSNWAGKYLIAANKTTFMDGSLPGGSSSGQIGYANTSVNPGSALSNNKITAEWGDEHYLEIEAIDSEDLTKGYLLKTHNASTPYIYNTEKAGDGNMSASVNVNTAKSHPYTITFKSSSEIDLRVHSNASLRYNSSNKIFRFYDSANQSVYLYSYVAGDVVYNSNPSEGVKCSINWMVEGETYHTDLLNIGKTINKPTTDPASVNNRVFVGWSSTEITGHANTFTNFTSHTCTGETETWYAVFATPEYTKANAIADGGTYIITSQKGGKTVYLPNAAATGDSPVLGTAIDVNGTKLSTVVTPDMLWTFNEVTGGWQIQSVAEQDKYLGTTSSNGKYVRVNTTSTNNVWTVSDNKLYCSTQSKYIGPYTDDDHWYANSSSTSNKFASTTITFYTPVNSYRNYTTAPETATYSVVYDLNGGEGTAINQHELLSGTQITLPAAPTLAGSAFTGWNDGSQTYAAGANYTIASANVTFTAQWGTLTPTSITITVPQEVVNAELTVGQTPVQLGLTFEPAGLSEGQKAVTWSVKSGDESLISVTQEGLVSALACGETATVYATSNVDANIRGEYIFHIKMPACDNYSFHYGNSNGSGWNYYCEPICFEVSAVSDGTQDGHFWFADFVLPSDDKEFYVGWQNNWATNSANVFASEIVTFSNMYFHHYHKVDAEKQIKLGNFGALVNAGAIGTLCVWGGYPDNNKYVDFVPGGYVLRLGSGDNWTSYEFAPNDATNILETEWTTDFITLTSDIISGKSYVALKANNAAGFVATPNKTEEKTISGNMGIKTGAGDSWKSGNIIAEDAGKHGKFRIWVDNNTKNFNCHFVPYYQIAFDSDGGSAVAPGYVSIEADSKSYTVTMSPETNPTRVGYQFVGWNDGSTTHTESWTINNISQNITLTAVWNKVNTLTFHYVGFTTDCDEQRSVATGGQVTLPAGKTVVGKTFDGWSDGNGNTYEAGEEYTMPANNVTLTATYSNFSLSVSINGELYADQQEVATTGFYLPVQDSLKDDKYTPAPNNHLVGYTKTAINNETTITDLPNDFIPAGSVYTPTAAGETLYALYRQGDAEYKLIKDIKDLRLGAHVVLASIDEDYAMGKEFIAGQDTLPAIVVTKDGDEETITFGNDVQEWILDASDSKDHVGEWSFKKGSNTKYLAAPSVGKDKLNIANSKTVTACFTLAIDASGRVTAKSVVATSTTTHNTLSMGEKGFFACYNPNTIDAPDLAIYQHIGTKYVTTPTAVYRVKSVDMVNGRIDKNDYYVVNDTITLSGYANEGYSTSNVYRVYGEAAHDTISKTRGFRMPAYNVVDTLTNRAFVDTLKFVVPECVTPTPSNIRANGSTEVNLPNDVANVNSWNFVGWTKTAINDTSEVHSEIFTTYTTPRLKKDSAETFYAIYSYDGLETEGFVLSTVNSETTYYLGEYVSGSNNYYFSVTTDKGQALTLYLDENKLYYLDGGVKKYLRANFASSSYTIRIEEEANKANATVWTIEENEETGAIAIKTNIGGSDRYLRYNTASSRYNIYSIYSDPVKEKAPSYTTNPVCTLYAYYFTSDAEGAEPEYVYELGQDGKVIPYSPANECGAKRFMGWSETKVSALQQSAPSMVDVATQTYDRDVNLYAVYAAPNGGKVVDTPTITDNVTAMGAFKTAQDSGMTSLNTRYYYHNAKYWSNNNSMRMTKGKDADTSYITTSLIRDLEKIQVVYNTSNLKPLVYISANGTDWTVVDLKLEGGNYFATPETPGDYYVAFSITRGAGDSYSYSDVQAVTYTHNKEYWYSDYSTNCNVAETATITYDESTESAHQTTSIGEVITLPTPKTAGKHFEGWTINGVNYDGDESYKLSYDVTATATWTEAQLTCTPETLYVVSAKGKTVRSSQTIQISCPDITTGTLTIADQTSDSEKTIFHAVITNAEANEETGLNATVAIEFTPNALNQNRNATMTATIGEEPNQKQVQFHVHGRSLPDQFVIAHQGADEKWYALPADITAYKTYAGYEITIDNNNATAPASAVYNLYADSTDEEHKHNPEIVRLAAPNGGRALQAQAADKTNIKVGDSIQYAVDSTYKWIIQTTDNENYTFLNAKTGRALNNNGTNFGTYTSGESLRIFKVTTSTITIPITVTEWRENGFSFIPSIAIPANDAFSLVVNGATIAGATCIQRSNLYDVTYTSPIAAQQTMQLKWSNSSQPVATATVVTPARATDNTTLSELLTGDVDAKNLDIVVASGTLTVDAKATIHNLDIYPGATVAITNDTLTTTTLSFHGGLTSTESNYNYDVPRLYIQKEGCSTAPGYIKKNTHVYYYLNVNADNFYPFTVPFKTSGANIRYASKPNTEIESIWGNAIKISKYDGEARGKGETTTTKYWKDVAYSNDIIPGVGYIITAKKLKGEQYATLRIMMMVSDIDATTDTAAVGAWGVGPETTTAWYNQGWNYIANPYTAMLTGSADEEQHAIQSGTTVRYATIPSPTVDGYDQVPITDADLKPFYGFFIQAGATGNYNFVKNIHNGAPAYLLAEEKPEQEAYISLEGAAMRDRFGLIVGPGHTNDYEINADLTKELGSANDLRAWLMAGETKMAYLAIDDETARTLIPLNLRTPAEGEYTFSLRGSSRVEDLEGVYLYDYENGTVTNMINSDYTFSAPAGAVENRFALSAIRQNKAPTDIGGQIDGRIGREAERLKIVKDGHIYIIVNGVTFDAEGKEVTK